uniref:Uncharacterized protein n=1 Tax=Octopus bimaculoides TaxID=37653 RepID=A0A0L8I048_OCTBM
MVIVKHVSFSHRSGEQIIYGDSIHPYKTGKTLIHPTLCVRLVSEAVGIHTDF